MLRFVVGSLGVAIFGCGITLGGRFTLGGVTTLVDGVSLVGRGITGIVVWTRYFLVVGRRVACFLIAGGFGGEMDGAGGGMVVIGIQLVNSSHSLDIDVNC